MCDIDHTAQISTVPNLLPRAVANMCHFDEKCTRADCTYRHTMPKQKPANMCHFDEKCTRAGCTYRHTMPTQKPAPKQLCVKPKHAQLPGVPQWCVEGATVVLRRNGRVASIVAVEPDCIVVIYTESGMEADCLLSDIALAPPLQMVKDTVAKGPGVSKASAACVFPMEAQWATLAGQLVASSNAAARLIGTEMQKLRSAYTLSDDLNFVGLKGRYIAEAFAVGPRGFMRQPNTATLKASVDILKEKGMISVGVKRHLDVLRRVGNLAGHVHMPDPTPQDIENMLEAAFAIVTMVERQVRHRP